VEHRISNGQIQTASDGDVTVHLRKHHKILVLVDVSPVFRPNRSTI
jgi:phosphopantothenate synthetase